MQPPASCTPDRPDRFAAEIAAATSLSGMLATAGVPVHVDSTVIVEQADTLARWLRCRWAGTAADLAAYAEGWEPGDWGLVALCAGQPVPTSAVQACVLGTLRAKEAA